MSAPSFTPGPWKTGRAAKASNFGNHRALVHGPDVARIATVNGGNTDSKEMAEANARLIAAAPDLYAALARALHLLDGTDPAAFASGEYVTKDGEWDAGCLEHSETMDAANAALKAARGEV